MCVCARARVCVCSCVEARRAKRRRAVTLRGQAGTVVLSRWTVYCHRTKERVRIRVTSLSQARQMAPQVCQRCRKPLTTSPVSGALGAVVVCIHVCHSYTGPREMLAASHSHKPPVWGKSRDGIKNLVPGGGLCACEGQVKKPGPYLNDGHWPVSRLSLACSTVSGCDSALVTSRVWIGSALRFRLLSAWRNGTVAQGLPVATKVLDGQR